jgi:predicted ATPase
VALSTYTEIVRTVQLVAPFFEDFVLEPLATNPMQTMLRWREHGSDVVSTGHQLSDGTLRFIALATALLQPIRRPRSSSTNLNSVCTRTRLLCSLGC